MRVHGVTMWLAIGAFAWASVGQGAEIRLRAQATVDSPIVTLGTIAEIRQADASRASSLADTELCPAPIAGQSAWLDLAMIQDHLVRRGVDLTTVQFVGSRRVQVTRDGVHDAADAPKPGAATAKTAEQWEELLVGMLRESVERSTGLKEGQYELGVECKRAIEHLARFQPSRWDLVPPGLWSAGAHSIPLEIPTVANATSVEGTCRFTLHAVLKTQRPVVVANRPLPRGYRITIEDVEQATKLFASEDELRIEELADALGKETTRPIEPGQPLVPRDVKSIPIVFRGSQVTVHVRYRTAALEISALAKEDGGLGDWIEVVNPTTRQPLETKVRVTGFQTAEMPTAAPPAATPASGVAEGRPARSTRDRQGR